MIKPVASIFGSNNSHLVFFFFFNDTATTEIYTLSLHDALPIYINAWMMARRTKSSAFNSRPRMMGSSRSEEHTSELKSLTNLVCRLLLEKKRQHLRGGRKRTSLICMHGPTSHALFG